MPRNINFMKEENLLKIAIDKLKPKFLAVVLCLLCCLGSMYYWLRGYTQFALMMIFGVLVIYPILKKKFILVNRIQFINCILMGVFIVRNNPKLQSTASSEVFMILFMLIFIVLVKYQQREWIDYTISLCKLFYLFYAVYTILEKFFEPLFLFSLRLFPSSIETLYTQYSRGCMPGLTNHYSTNGMLLGVGFIVFSCEAIFKGSKKNIILSGVMIVALLLTGKRADIIFTAVGIYLAYYCYMSDKKRTRIKNTVLIILAVLVGLVILVNLVPSLATFITRFEETTDSGDVTLGRTKMWAIAIDCFKNNTLLGIGWDRFKFINLHEWKAHNIYLQLLAETGIVGFIVFAFFFVYTFVCGWRHLKRIRIDKMAIDREEVHLLFSLAMQVFFLLYGITGNPLYDKETYVPYYIACAITSYYTHSRKNIYKKGE